MHIEISKEYACLAWKKGLDDPLNEQAAHSLMLKLLSVTTCYPYFIKSTFEC